MNIAAFGDSNTRYWLGDQARPGPGEDAYPAVLEKLLWDKGLPSQVRNLGCPGEQADFAQAEFRSMVGHPDLCILGFGTNDIKRPEVALETYLEEMEGVLRQAEEEKIPCILLNIPWFGPGYGGPGGQARLPVWNGALEALCARYAVPVVDLCGTFCGNPDRWYNERGVDKRHLSAAAQRHLAELLIPLVLERCR